MIELDKLLDKVVDVDASDLFLTVGLPPVIKLHGKLRRVETGILTPFDTESYMKGITPERCQLDLKERGTCDFGFAYKDRARFRVCVFKQKGNIGIALRLIPRHIKSLEEIGLPPAIKTLLYRPRGLIAVTGPTGSGKTTSQAAMINFINENMGKHIVTIEDPIEYYHEHKQSIITQREVGVDVPSFAEGVVRALRMAPDIILVGEMRDLDTIRAAIVASETGHIVFATLHTTGSAKTISRIIEAFPVDEQEEVRVMLSNTLIAVLSQVLLPRSDEPGRIAAFELMIMTDAIANLIRDNQIHKIQSFIQTSSHIGMIPLDEYLFNLYIQRKITYQDLMRIAQRPQDLELKVKEYAYAAAQRK
jgi:twitching motility protein PilT